MTLASFRLIFVTYCHHCRCHESGWCYRHLMPVKPWDTCRRWAE